MGVGEHGSCVKRIPASATPEVPLVAFIGESQVGKSSLVNALAGARVLPTTVTGIARSQAVCEWAIPPSHPPDANWCVSMEWLPRGVIKDVVDSKDAARARLLRQGVERGYEASFARAFRSLNGSPDRFDVHAWAMGRAMDWLPLDTPRSERDARRQVEALSGGWPAALASFVRIRGAGPASLRLVDLPGLGHDDVGGQASAAWLKSHAARIAAVVCVVGKRTPELLDNVLHSHWLTDEIRDRLIVVATFADNLVEDHTNMSERQRAAMARRHRAAEHLRSFARGTVDLATALPRTFCLDPRPDSRFWRKVEFDGELDRLRERLAGV
nr:GTPase [Thiocystis minor]